MRWLLFFLVLASTSHGKPPNIILMLADDLGGTDLGCFGSAYHETPHLDALAKAGMKFSQAYSACTVCSPTRAALLTGKSSARLRITDWIAGHERPHARLRIPDWTKRLPLEESTLAELLKAKGYATASVGKWHLGAEDGYPEKHGFDLNVGGTNRGQPPSYFSPYGIPTLPDGPKGEFLSDRLTDEAIRFVEANRERPFFLYFPHFAVHTPIMGKPEVTARFAAKKGSRGQADPEYAALLASVDDSVGRLRAKLSELGLRENTLFLFTSDNGGLSDQVGPKGWSRGPTSNSPHRLGKGGSYEGGVRVPLLVEWPAVAKPGIVEDSPVISQDLFLTALEAAEISPPNPADLDGESLLPLLRQTGKLRRTALHWHYPHYHPGGATPHGAIREGNWKLIEFFEDGRLELYHLGRDPGEADNVAPLEADRAKDLHAKLVAWRQRVGAQMPTPNPAYDPNRP